MPISLKWTHWGFVFAALIGAAITCVTGYDRSIARLFLLPHFVKYVGETFTCGWIFLVPFSKLRHGWSSLRLYGQEITVHLFRNHTDYKNFKCGFNLIASVPFTLKYRYIICALCIMFYLKDTKNIPFHLHGHLVSSWTFQVWWAPFHGVLRMNPCAPMKEMKPLLCLQL